MKVTFIATGAENISLEALSAMLKKHGHQTHLAFDRALFKTRPLGNLCYEKLFLGNQEESTKKA
ncbi:MAG: hypothetical protein ABIK53_09045 [bacterium]